MSDQFDPYYKWLGIPPEEQPPSHYRLLGLPPFTDDPDVIENAADQRMGHLRTFQSGKNAQHSQRILNELSQARVALLNPHSKADYDQQLRAKIDGTSKEDLTVRQTVSVSQAATGIGSAPNPVPLPAQFASPNIQPRKPLARKNANHSWLLPALLGGGVLVAILVVMIAVLVLRIQFSRNVAQNAPVNISDPIEKPQQNGTPANSNTPAKATPVTKQDPPAKPSGKTVGNFKPTKPAGQHAIGIKPRTYVELANTKGLVARDQPFTIEFWMRCKTDVIIRVIGDRLMGGNNLPLPKGENAGWTVAVFEKDGVSPLVALQNGGNRFREGENFKWFHFAMSSDGGDIELFENGRSASTRKDVWDLGIRNILIGDGPDNRRPALEKSSSYFEIAGVRISSTHRYPADFVPQASFVVDSKTEVLLNFSTPVEGMIRDVSGKNRHGKIIGAEWVKIDENG